MLTYIFKRDNFFLSHFFTIFDVKGRKLKLTLAVLFLLLLHAIFFNFAFSNYLSSLQAGYSSPGVDNPYDYAIPYISMILIFIAFYDDYKDKTYELLGFYNNKGFNFNMFYRWLINTGIFGFGTFICGILYYRNVAFLDSTSLLLSLRFLPNILFLTALILCITAFTKSSYVGFFVSTLYITLDYISDARLFKFMSLGVNANNYYYNTSPSYYLFNRTLLIVISVVLVYAACKKSYR